MAGTPKRERLELFADYFNVSVDYLIGRNVEGDEEKYNTSEETIRLLEEKAEQMGLNTSDPAFQKMLSDAFDLLRMARQQNS